MTPAQRQAARTSVGSEQAHSAMGNGSLFTLKAGAPHAGTVVYGPLRRTHSIAEAQADGGVQTKDLHLADALRSLGIYGEAKL